MRFVALLIACSLSGCAVHNYMVISGGPGSPQAMKADLDSCRLEAEGRYHHAINTPARILGNAVGGAIGGLVASADASNPDADPFQINRNIEACMLLKGYSGHSSG
ncbi:MAG TPA: hypothetical protein VGN16_09415 [Acidobacteriaceae bacterium]